MRIRSSITVGLQRLSWMGRVLLVALFAAQSATAEPVLRVATTLFPLFDWARIVGGDRVDATLLLPPGVDPHMFSPRPSDIRRLDQSDVWIFLGADFEPWIAGLLKGLERSDRIIIEAARGICRGHPDDHTHADCEHAHAHTGGDPHIWLDPMLAREMVSTIADGFAQADPAGAAVFRQRADAYQEQLDDLHRRIASALATSRHREILYAGHFAFGHFARRYDLRHRSPYAGFSSDARPTPRQLAEMIRHSRETGQTTLFVGVGENPRIATLLSRETGMKTAELHSLHNLTRTETQRGTATYLSLMEQNLRVLRKGLNPE